MIKKLLIFLLFSLGLVGGAFAGTSDTVRMRIVECDSLVWFGTTLYHDTMAEHWEVEEEDSLLYMLDLTINSSVRLDFYDTTAACSPYEWHDSIFVETGDYSFVYQSANGCDSVETLHLIVLPSPEMHAISGDTLVCRNQYIVFSYPNDDLEHYEYFWFMSPDIPMGTNAPSIEWFTGDSDPGFVTFKMRVTDLEYQCSYDTLLMVRVCDKYAPERVSIRRKSTSNILVCDGSQGPDLHFRWGRTDKNTGEETACNWDHEYYQYDMPIDTALYEYWVEVYTVHGDAICYNRSYYDAVVGTETEQKDSFKAIAHLQGDQLWVNIDNPGKIRSKALLYDMSGRLLAEWDFGTEPYVRRQMSFSYPSGTYILSIQAGDQCHTTKIAHQR